MGNIQLVHKVYGSIENCAARAKGLGLEEKGFFLAFHNFQTAGFDCQNHSPKGVLKMGGH